MGLVREPLNVDLDIQSKPWTKKELEKLSEIIRKSKLKNRKKKVAIKKASGKKEKSV